MEGDVCLDVVGAVRDVSEGSVIRGVSSPWALMCVSLRGSWPTMNECTGPHPACLPAFGSDCLSASEQASKHVHHIDKCLAILFHQYTCAHVTKFDSH